MKQSPAKFVVSIPRSIKKIVEETKLQFVIENFAELPQREIKVSPKIELSAGAVWLTTVTKVPCNDSYSFCMFGVHVEEKPECLLKSTKFIAKGTIRDVSGTLEVLRPGVIPMNKGKGMIEAKILMIQSPNYGPASNKLASLISSGGSLVVDFSLSVELNWEEKAMKKFCDRSVLKNQIVANNSQLLIDSKYSDFEFVVKGSKFKVHKAFLGPASEVFANLFASEMEESKTNKCTVPHLDPIAFGNMLKFIYSGQLPEDFNADVALGLFEVAHYYDVKSLKNICEQEVLFGLNAENALEWFKLAQLYDLKELKGKSWVIVKRDVLKIYRQLKQEPLTLEAIDAILDQQEKETKFWETF